MDHDPFPTLEDSRPGRRVEPGVCRLCHRRDVDEVGTRRRLGLGGGRVGRGFGLHPQTETLAPGPKTSYGCGGTSLRRSCRYRGRVGTPEVGHGPKE